MLTFNYDNKFLRATGYTAAGFAAMSMIIYFLCAMYEIIVGPKGIRFEKENDDIISNEDDENNFDNPV